MNIKCAVFWDVMPCILKMEAAGINTGISLLPATCHFSDDCNLNKSLRAVRSFYNGNIFTKNNEIFNSYVGKLKATYFVVILLNGKD